MTDVGFSAIVDRHAAAMADRARRWSHNAHLAPPAEVGFPPASGRPSSRNPVQDRILHWSDNPPAHGYRDMQVGKIYVVFLSSGAYMALPVNLSGHEVAGFVRAHAPWGAFQCDLDRVDMPPASQLVVGWRVWLVTLGLCAGCTSAIEATNKLHLRPGGDTTLIYRRENPHAA